MFLFLLILYASDFKIKSFPVNYNNQNTVFHKTNLKTNISIKYDLSKQSLAWCDNYKNNYKSSGNNLFLNCYGLNKKNYKEAFYAQQKASIKNYYILETATNPFKIFYYIKKNYYRNNFCLIKDNNKYKLISYIKRDNFKELIDEAIKKYNKLNKDEVSVLYEFFISSFNSSCEKYLFYYQATFYGFYEVENLFMKKYWLE